MLTLTQAYTRTQDITGVGQDATSLINFKMDINQGLRLFKNAARRYWTRVEKTTDIVQSQQSYTLPEDCVRITQVKATYGGFQYPLEEISSEHRWNQLNVIPSVTTGTPQFYFVRGRNEVLLWPVPSMNVTAGLDVSYEPRMADMSVDDITTATTGATVTVGQGTTTVTASSPIFSQSLVGTYFTVTDGTDGLWYKIAGFSSTTVVTLENYYQGVSGSGRSFLVGSVPDIPEDYHMALVYYACYNFYLKRKDVNIANNYWAMFEEHLKEFKMTYSSKSTGVVTNSAGGTPFNIWTLPPTNMS